MIHLTITKSFKLCFISNQIKHILIKFLNNIIIKHDKYTNYYMYMTLSV